MRPSPSAYCRAARLYEYERPIRIENIDAPTPGINEVLVRVNAAGVNPVDWKIQAGLRRERMPIDLPVTLGCDVAGTVIGLGHDVGNVQVGDRVMAMVGLYGAFQDVVSIPSSRIAVIPSALTFEEAAAMPLPALTALQALELLRPQPGESILIHAAGGSVGGFAVQLAKLMKLRVIGTASAGKHERLATLGADLLIDYTRARYETGMEQVDMVLDLVGGDTQRRSWQLLRGTAGRLVSSISIPEPGVDGRPFEVHAQRVGVQSNGAQLGYLAGLAANGQLKSEVAHVHPLDEVERLLCAIRANEVTGKSVLTFHA